MTNLRAIDLYSGIGGWSLGLNLAGIDVVASYDIWEQANQTNHKNSGHPCHTVDIRTLSLSTLPENIDIVVGSPPCTQFSFANRGGSGDIADGLTDVYRFLEIVEYLKPRFWAMENVPRVAAIIETELLPGGRLDRFVGLNAISHVVNMQDFGLPQRRRRCITGNFDPNLLQSYQHRLHDSLLGDVILSLALNPVVDPIYGLSLEQELVTDHIWEARLTDEEVRINKANKTLHPVYNSMSFPDDLNRTSRTITATCTRVSRESIVIPVDSAPNYFRRLTVRERASLQGFPITFQLHGKSYSQRQRMVGNAFPPPMAFYVAKALLTTPPDQIPLLGTLAHRLQLPEQISVSSTPDQVPGKYSPRRPFRFAIPSLHLKSGVRFELVNGYPGPTCEWQVKFYFGNPKSIHQLAPGNELSTMLLSKLPEHLFNDVLTLLDNLCDRLSTLELGTLQHAWSRQSTDGTHPFTLLDLLDNTGTLLQDRLSTHSELALPLVTAALQQEFGPATSSLAGLTKLARNAPLVLAGLLIGAALNSYQAATAPPAMDSAP